MMKFITFVKYIYKNLHNFQKVNEAVKICFLAENKNDLLLVDIIIV